MCFEMEEQCSGGGMGPEYLQSDDSSSLDVFGDIEALIADLPDFATTPHARPSVSRTVELSSEGVSEVVLTLESIGGSENGYD